MMIPYNDQTCKQEMHLMMTQISSLNGGLTVHTIL
jgi:hypothetical protein